jgi:hypothetical protein
MLLWMIGEGPRSPFISGVPSLLGRAGLREAAVDGGRSAKWANSGGACICDFPSVVWDGRRSPLLIPFLVISCCRCGAGRRVCDGPEDIAGSRSVCNFPLLSSVSIRTAEAGNGVVIGSGPNGSARSSGVLYLATEGLACKGLTCRVRLVVFADTTTPGEYEDMEVGVDETLNGPGDPEYRVEGVVERAY